MDNNNELKCSECGQKFIENDFSFICEECGAYYCYECFCKDHFEQHSTWEVFKVENGRFKLIQSEKSALKDINLKKFPPESFIKFCEKIIIFFR